MEDIQLKEKDLKINNLDNMVALFGDYDQNVKQIEERLGVSIIARDTNIKILGDDQYKVQKAWDIMEKLLCFIKKGEVIDKSKVRYTMDLILEGNDNLIDDIMSEVICLNYRGKPIKCKTMGQRRYIDAIEQNDVVFGIGPAGTGKTYLAMAMAVTAFKNKRVNRIVLTRPAVEAGEKLGFLPGDLQNKVDPYLRPLYDALYDLMGPDTYLKFIEHGVIEVAPLAYMRGRTLDDSFIILDEAQNTTSEQMKMFLTRMGTGSKMVITGDITQVDLPRDKHSGLIEAEKVLKDIEGIGFAYLTYKDVVRHELVMKIIEAYDRYNNKGA